MAKVTFAWNYCLLHKRRNPVAAYRLAILDYGMAKRVCFQKWLIFKPWKCNRNSLSAQRLCSGNTHPAIRKIIPPEPEHFCHQGTTSGRYDSNFSWDLFKKMFSDCYCTRKRWFRPLARRDKKSLCLQVRESECWWLSVNVQSTIWMSSQNQSGAEREKECLLKPFSGPHLIPTESVWSN